MDRRMGERGDVQRAWPKRECLYPQIINNQSSFINRRGFTLIELLVVIAIIGMLMAILMPSLQRVRRQAGSVGCHANLRQWGILYATYTSDNNGRLPTGYGRDEWSLFWRWSSQVLGSEGTTESGRPTQSSFTAIEGLLRCPMAAKPGFSDRTGGLEAGGTFFAWGWRFRQPSAPEWYWRSSYAPNEQAHSWPVTRPDLAPVADAIRFMWMTSAVKNAATIPVFFDSAGPLVTLYNDKSAPPERDAIPTMVAGPGSYAASCVCMNRHDGRINSLFMDWSVRKVGLKELWTFKWHTQYNTQGPWTKAGGAEAEDWPQWMRNFKDY
jgi:prepilin-type N-terminal cleavage/methylation domain-containing protein/prepilin-type processing-associated H-X9-DG protein